MVESHVRVQLRDYEELGHLSSTSYMHLHDSWWHWGSRWGVGLGCHLKSIALLKPGFLVNLWLLQFPTVVFQNLSTILRNPRIPNGYSSSLGHIAANVFNSGEIPGVRIRQYHFDEIPQYGFLFVAYSISTFSLEEQNEGRKRECIYFFSSFRPPLKCYLLKLISCNAPAVVSYSSLHYPSQQLTQFA